MNLESSSRLFSGKSNPDCGEHGFDGDSVDKVSCGSGMQCAYYTATVKETAPVSKCNSSFYIRNQDILCCIVIIVIILK